MYTTEDQILIESRVANERKSAAAAYFLWFFLGWISAHRFYLGKPVTAILQILSYFILIGFVWWVADLFLIPSIINDKTDESRHRFARDLRRYAY
ncbi:MAG: TM2 domain-containing protein [Hyphomonas sp.]|uniref:TM2 domain-containing protein n=1 Tax=Hyphomonas sp. TaxID=87 RepID=UPI0017E87D22|nr:TM2 domain-containing protein [Hyphomonas sp.]MBU3920475.1 TM2 domain-containing protein [Alphaproteobacteria bacterium]MBA3068438.1 TM2 domain-containing protein [Hyphomonas sp.]MBU4060694.1 TM2 domain-containing protein [Alphaproteobacteria bacterium]MBU4164678.1 TM2 domain-containing protein [Alphaproteobacteria bacterium]MBU4569595.1 TM2 domain-containing protein [Alphaproteobacteria bacterium]